MQTVQERNPGGSVHEVFHRGQEKSGAAALRAPGEELLVVAVCAGGSAWGAMWSVWFGC